MTAPQVILVSGHLTDAPGRPERRFEETEVARVARDVHRVLEHWGVGPGTTLVCGGGRGADLIGAEEALALGADVVLCLAQPPDAFARQSVAGADPSWPARFDAVRERAAAVEVLPEDQHPGNDGSIHAATNTWMISRARLLGGGVEPRVVVVWNGREGDGPGGTRDFLRQLGIEKPQADRLAIIDPTHRRYEHHQDPSVTPKRMLALDGGGIRGVVTLQILKEIEQQLRHLYGDPKLQLSDYFDFIGGTSTGGMLAAALAQSRLSLDQLYESYRDQGTQIFKKRRIWSRLRSLYGHKALEEEIRKILGEGCTLGDPDMKTLLLLVLHNAKTDSAWPLTNNTAARYNRVDRCLLPTPDRNLDLSLTQLVRGSAAAPVFFAPEQIQVGKSSMLFEDGGITPFNNPALLMYAMATAPQYALGWEAGADKLLIVSVGTGSSAAEHPKLEASKTNLFFHAKNLPSVFMNGASAGQDLMCRVLGQCRYGPVIDAEFGDGIGERPNAAFSYVRYEADLSDEALTALGITEEKKRAEVRKLDGVDQIPALRDIGIDAARTVDVTRHFAGFVG